MYENRILKQVLKEKFVSKEEIRELIRRYKEETDEISKQNICDIIFKNNIRYIRKISSKLSKLYSDPEDCFQNGVLGFYCALEKFDLSKKTAFTTYLFYWVFKSIYEGSQLYPVDVPRNIQHMNSVFMKYKNIVEQNDQQYNSVFLNRRIFQDKSFKDKYLENENGPLEISVFNLDAEIHQASGKKMVLRNFIKDSKPSPEFLVIKERQKEQLFKIMEEKLNEKQKSVIMLRYFSDTDNLLSLKEVGDKLDIVAERVRQIEETALFKLKRALTPMKREGII